MHWKIARDPYYAALHAQHGAAFIAEAGFFADTATEDAPLDDLTTLCTPTTCITDRLPAPRPAVLVCTGSFSPVHSGHLAMMAAARRSVEAAGYTVVGGYLSPGHDEYLALKLGDAALSAPHRLRLCAAAVAETDWLMVDPWEAMHRDVAVNFTDVVHRLTAYLHHHISPQLTVFYVCGGDNARFALTFAQRGSCVVVGRPGTEDRLARYRTHPLLVGNPRILWADGRHAGSSTAARRGNHTVLPAAVERQLTPRRPASLTLRLESADVAWGRAAALARFQRQLADLLSRWFVVREARLASQRIPQTPHPIISLDPLLPGRHALDISRRFDLGGTTQRRHCARPDAPPLSEQLAAIPPGTYALFDDDICTGGTIAAVRASLPPHITIADTLHLTAARAPEGRQEIADSRDFLLGSRAGGLVVALPDGSLGRAPYLLPFVCPAARVSIPDAAVHEFSRRLWQLNAEFFADSGLTVADLPPATRRLARCAGFTAERPLEALCRAR